jgi:hypothetical protein
MIKTPNYNFTCPQGATFDVLLTWKDNAGAPVDLTGCSAALQVRPTYSSPAPLIDIYSGDGITLGDALGTIHLVVDAAITEAVPAGSYVYDLKITFESGSVTRLMQGKWQHTAEVTQ